MDGGLIFIPLLLIFMAVVLLLTSKRQRTELHIPEGKAVYQDTVEHPGDILYSHTYQLKGKPDLLLEDGQMYIPVEVKTRRAPRYPYEGHIMQLMAYCLLVAERYGRPAYGVIRYSDRSFNIEFTAEREARLIELLAEMRQKRAASQVHRSHRSSRVCQGCGYKHLCDERLGEQLSMFPS